MSAYRPNVGIVVFNRDGEVLQGERIDFPNAWQFPQGGIDEGESARCAAERELYEEVGIKDAILVYEHPEWLTYDYPPAVQEKYRAEGKRYYQGQRQKWFLFYWHRAIDQCNLEYEQEFRAVRFVPIGESLQTIPDFKRGVYEQVVSAFQPKIREYLQGINPAD